MICRSRAASGWRRRRPQGAQRNALAVQDIGSFRGRLVVPMTSRSPNTLARSEMYVPGAYVQAYIEAARSVDVDPYRQLRQARLPTTGLDDAEMTVPQERFVELVQATAQVAQRP